ncbi:hypothetical protein LDENG_00254880 [Lucifuga dentata]|nr:hypothetical protein LDENG_00254880 [Lucifuga dentata]
MDSKADVKAIMAHFQAGATNSEDSSPTAGRPKQALHPTLSSGPTLPKKPVLESLSGSAITIPPKPIFLKSTISSKSDTEDTEVQESNKTKALASRLANMQDETNANKKPLIVNKQPIKLPLSQASEVTSSVPKPKPPLSNKLPLSSTLSDPKPVFPKSSPALNPKPSWMKEDSGDAPSILSSTPPKIPALQQKPKSTIERFIQQNEEMAGANTDTVNKSIPTPSSPVKPSSNFRTVQNIFNKENKDKTEQPDSGVKGHAASKLCLGASNSTPPPMPPASKKPSLMRKPPSPCSQKGRINGDATSTPKHNPLPNIFALGPPPAKPNRPPKVNLESFRRGAEPSENGPGTLKKPIIPSPPPSHPSNHSNNVTPSQPPLLPGPTLPPRHPAAIIQPDPDENYDDVGVMNSPAPPPLPPSTGHPSQRAKAQEGDDNDGEMYEDLDERWEAADEKKREKEEEEKKRLEAEKKEQKEREKKEHDARKRFKLVGPLETVHQGKACVDNKGSKTELTLKKGDCVDVIRVQGNPEGKWLGRTQDGSIGYVKITSVEIDFDTLKQQGAQQAYEPEVYDDIDSASNDNFKSGIKRPGVILPPPPGNDGEIYDDVVDPSLDVSPRDPKSPPPKPRGFLWMFERKRPSSSTNELPPPSQFIAEGNSDKPGAVIDEEIYDDVDQQSVPPPPPPVSSHPTVKTKSRTDEMDPKRLKRMEKEEKDFRKKFKYEGDIQVLYQVTIIPTLTIKKWSGKDLPIKPGETLNVIVKAVDNKLTCRNEDGKFGYVSTSHIVMEDADIYDDVGDSIYDND